MKTETMIKEIKEQGFFNFLKYNLDQLNVQNLIDANLTKLSYKNLTEILTILIEEEPETKTFNVIKTIDLEIEIANELLKVACKHQKISIVIYLSKQYF